uniref:Putative secreted protein n=1 Tax=Ixodes scapularis TaxID=6945 RepID=A0A4D5RBM9_IXOSC
MFCCRFVFFFLLFCEAVSCTLFLPCTFVGQCQKARKEPCSISAPRMESCQKKEGGNQTIRRWLCVASSCGACFGMANTSVTLPKKSSVVGFLCIYAGNYYLQIPVTLHSN